MSKSTSYRGNKPTGDASRLGAHGTSLPRNRGRVGRSTRDQLADLGSRLLGPLRQQHAGLIPHGPRFPPHGIAELVPNHFKNWGEKNTFCLKKLLKRILETNLEKIMSSIPGGAL